MVAPSKRIVAALTLACGLSAMLALARPVPASADSEGPRSDRTEPCIVGHRFEPGPIVDGHYRQPTPAEFEARTRELRALSDRGPCSAPPVASTAGDMASGARPASAPAVTQR
jgi:hypothetical protein